MTINEAVKQSGFSNIFDAGSRNKAQKSLADNETLLFAYNCSYAIVPHTTKLDPTKVYTIKNKKSGVFAVTDKRVFLCSSLVGETEFKDIPLSKIQSIDDVSSFIARTAQLRIQGLTEIFILDLIAKQKKHISEVRSIIYSAMNQQSTQKEIPLSSSPADQLMKYKELLDAGLITIEEFNSQKAKLL